jgi:putative phosphoesterase
VHKYLIGIISDTHDNRNTIARAVKLFNDAGVSLVVHAGDVISPFTALDFKLLACPMEMVFGNNDGERIGLSSSFKGIGNLLPGPRTFTFQDKTFLLMHESGCLDGLINAAAIDIIIYGHTHELDIRKGHPLVINPGEAGGWLKGKATGVILDLNTMETEVISLDS